MCDTTPARTGGPPLLGAGPSRRTVLQAAAVLAGAALLTPTRAVAQPATGRPPAGPEALAIRPRIDWAGGLAPTGPLEVEAPGDVRFLLVHHTASPNGYAAADVPGLLRGFYRYHTGPDKEWPDIAYNFLVDAHGGVWEGREGSLHAPVRGSATGGSQGHALLCCYIGDFTATAPTPAAEAAMLALLAGLADSYGVDTTPGAVAEFVSRGSNRHPTGSTVRTSTISTHRQMSQTTCPGDVVHAAVQSRYQAEVTALRAGAVPLAAPITAEPQAAPPVAPSAAAEPPATTPSSAASAPSAPSRGPDPTGAPAPTAPRTSPVARTAAPVTGPAAPFGPAGMTAAGGAVVVAALAAGLARRRTHRAAGAASGDPQDLSDRTD